MPWLSFELLRNRRTSITIKYCYCRPGRRGRSGRVSC